MQLLTEDLYLCQKQITNAWGSKQLTRGPVAGQICNHKGLETMHLTKRTCNLVCLFCCFTSQSTAMVMGGRPVHLTTLVPGQA